MNLTNGQSFSCQENINFKIRRKKPWLKFHIVTIFPEMIYPYIQNSIIKRAREKNAVQINVYNLRQYTNTKQQKVDDKPYGGGPGMVLKIEPIYKVLEDIKKNIVQPKQMLVALTDAGGITWSQSLAEQWLQWKIDKSLAEESFKFSKKTIQPIININPKFTDIVIICGRYQGVDARIKHFIDERITVGPFILTGGELPALIMVDTSTRLLPNVLGDPTSPIFETNFAKSSLVYPSKIKKTARYDVYTRPAKFLAMINGKKQILSVPEYLFSGDHQRIYEKRLALAKQ